MIKKIFFVLLFGFFALLGQAQINFSEDFMVERMMSRYVEINQANPTVAGWRIQVLASTDRRKVESAYASFSGRFPEYPCEWGHAKPYYKLKAGAFLTRLEAIAAVKKIKRYYRTALPTYDGNISIQEILSH